METKYTVEAALTKIGLGKYHFFLLLILGIIHSCDAIEMLILAFLGPILQCFWKITAIESSFITTGVFIGIMIGSTLLGNFSDKNGRKTTLIIANIALLYFGIMSANAPNIYWMIIMRCLIGCCIGGNSSSLHSLLSETTPLKYRGMFIISLQLFWSIGSILVTTFSWLIVPRFGWRLFLMLSTVPIVFVLISLYWIPESPRYLLLHNHKQKSLKVLNKIAEMNNVEKLSDLNEESIYDSCYKDLIHPNYRLTTIFTCSLWFVAGLTYYSVVLILTVMISVPHRCLQNMSTFSLQSININGTITDNSCCKEITFQDYRNIYISTIGEIVFIPVSFLLIYKIGRKKTLSVYIFIISIGILFLNFCLKAILLSVLLFVLRGSLMSFMSINFLYAIEVFPTSVRSTGSGFCNFSSRIGAILSSFIVNIIMAEYSFLSGTIILLIFNLIAFVISFMLPYETRNRRLYQTADHRDVELTSTNSYEKK